MTHSHRLQLAPAAAGFIFSTALLLSTSLQAIEFDLGDSGVQGTLKTDVTLGLKYGLQDYESPSDNEQNENDGYKSFDGGFVSQILKVTPELELKKDNYGLFVRGTAYYDHGLMSGDNKWAENNAKDVANGLADETGTFDGWSDELKENQGQGAKIQRAYLFGDWTFSGGQKLSMKLGDQAHDWGETIFYGGGLKDLNAYDVALNSLPGSKDDLLLGQGMLKLDFALNDQMSVGGFAQYDWEASTPMGRGSFKGQDSDLDIFVPGSDAAYYSLQAFADSLTGGDLNNLKGILGNIGVSNQADMFQVADTSGTNVARNGGQWGVKFKLEPESFKDTEFSVYYTNYHTSLPNMNAMIDSTAVGSAVSAVGSSPAVGLLMSNIEALVQSQGGDAAAVTAAQTQAQGALTGMHMLNNGTTAETVYAEDIKLWGASFHTKVFGYTQIAGELTYTENLPIWIDHPDDLIARMLSGVGELISGGVISDISQSGLARSYTPGDTYANYVQKPVWDASLSVIQPFGAVLSTDLMYVVGEVASQQVSGLSDYDSFTAKGASAYVGEAASLNADDRLDRFSWGYNLMLGANWNDVFKPGVNVKSTARFSHDVDGNSHRTGRFEAGEKKINLGLTTSYEDISATFTWGGDAKSFLREGVITAAASYTF
ncbi:hypothetical protein ACH42_05720 [Endozoicomonas sp. (ex Bugula neritina AB1)]|nr:hypothetical protein ACH42_05720 [Endozoicomonas sp. (ex Bugula neritina AB1)]